MDRENPSQEWRGITQTAIKCDTFWLQSFGTRHSCFANTKIICYCTVFALFYYFIFEGNFQVLAPGGLYSEGDLTEGFLHYEFWGLYLEGLFFGILRYYFFKHKSRRVKQRVKRMKQAHSQVFFTQGAIQRGNGPKYLGKKLGYLRLH